MTSAVAAPPRLATRSNATIRWLLIALLALSLAVRLWFASGGLGPQRFYDERYTLGNIARVLDGDLRPAYGWYPSLSYLPQAALLALTDRLHAATGIERLEIRAGPEQRFTPTAYLICRVLQCFYGVATLWLTFLIGCRLMSPGWALGSTLLLSVAPLHIRLSAYVKPDMLMLVMILLAFLAALATYARPSLGNYLIGGATIGLIASVKPYGASGALPLVVAALAQRQDRGRQLLRLSAAALASVALFLALNPFVSTLWSFARRNVLIYALKGEGRLSVLSEAFARVLGFDLHGPVVGVLAWSGVVLLAWTSLRSGATPQERARAGMIVLYLAGYVLVSTVLFTWAKANLFLPLAPFTALAAAWSARWVARRASPRLSPPARRLLAGLAAGLLVASLAWSLRLTYEARVPSTYRVAAGRLRSRLPKPLDGRLVCIEETLGGASMPGIGSTRHSAATVVRWPDLTRLGAGGLDACDAEVFPLARIRGATAPFYSGRVSRVESRRQRVVIRSRPLKSRGPALQLLLHPWRALSVEEIILRRDRAAPLEFTASLQRGPFPSERALASVDLELPKRMPDRKGCRLFVDGAEIPVHRLGIAGGGLELFASERFTISTSAAALRLRLARSPGRGRVPVRVRYWGSSTSEDSR